MAVVGQIGVVRKRAQAGVKTEKSALGVVLMETLSIALRLWLCELFWFALWLVGGAAQPDW